MSKHFLHQQVLDQQLKDTIVAYKEILNTCGLESMEKMQGCL